MEKLKKRTLIDRIRDAIKAFRGKSIGSIQFGIDVKRCSDCDRGADVLYLCDQKRCIKCHYPECKHTNDIRHAKNFEKQGGYFWEVEDPHIIKVNDLVDEEGNAV